MEVFGTSRFMSAEQLKELPYMIERDYGNIQMWVPTNAETHFHKFEPNETAYIVFSFPDNPSHKAVPIGVIVKYNNKEIHVPIGEPPHVENETLCRKFIPLEHHEIVIPVEIKAYATKKPNWSAKDSKDFVNCLQVSVRAVGDYLGNYRYYPVILSEKPLVR